VISHVSLSRYTILPSPLNSSRYFRRQYRYIRISCEWIGEKIRTCSVSCYRGEHSRECNEFKINSHPLLSARCASERKSTRCAVGNRNEYVIYRRTRKRDERRTSCSKDFVSPFTWSSPRDVSWATAAANMDSRGRPSGVLRKFIYRSLTHESEKKQPACQDIHLLPPPRLKKAPFSQDLCVDLEISL